jgi:hypothetical protein
MTVKEDRENFVLKLQAEAKASLEQIPVRREGGRAGGRGRARGRMNGVCVESDAECLH